MKNYKRPTWALVLLSLMIFSSANLRAQPEGLVLWNSMDSQTDIETSKVGPDLAFYTGDVSRTSFTLAKFNLGITIKPGSYNMFGTYPNVVLFNADTYINTERGTIECWYQQNADPLAYQRGVYRIFAIDRLALFTYDDPTPGPGSEPRLYFYIDSQTGVHIQAKSLVDNNNGVNISGLNGTLIHIAAVWDIAGIDGSSETVQLYVDGVKVGANTGFIGNTWIGSYADIGGGQDADIVDKFYVDNLKVWDYAKTNFDDRNFEGFITCPEEVTVECDVDLSPGALGYPEVIVNCEGDVAHSWDDVVVAGACEFDYSIERTWTITDACNNTGTCTQSIKVEDTTPPAITGIPTEPFIKGNDPEHCGALVEYPIINAIDNCAGEVNLTFEPPNGSFLPIGETIVTVTAIDPCGNTITESFSVIVDDIEDPVISVAPNALVLWPPNHKYYTVDLSDFIIDVHDNCSPLLSKDHVLIKQVTSDEPENDVGDGNTLNDIVIRPDCRSVDLRKERQGSGNGRLYSITVAVTDENGNEGEATYQVHIPKSKNAFAFDDGAALIIDGCGNSIARIASNKNAGKEFGEFNDILIYPNPADDIITLKFSPALKVNSDDLNFQIYSISGEKETKFKKRSVNYNKYEIDISNLPSGLYILEVPEFQDARFKLMKH